MNRINKHELLNVICIVIICLLGLIILHDICSSSVIGHSSWNSYELQARAWLKGQTHLDENYSHLELAVYEGKYYVSFPPFPSVFMLPFVMIFGDNVPNNLLIAAVCIATVIVAYKMLRKQDTNEYLAAFIAVFYVFGSNMLAMSLNGGVWFIAQALNMLLCTLAVKFCFDKKRMASYICLALAVGCRPFSALYIIAFIIIYFIRDYRNYKNTKGKKDTKSLIVGTLKPLIPVVVIAVIYMLYNYIRFKNPLEFGHNYLPEFTESEHGQFSTVYLWDNLKRLLFGAISFDSTLNFTFEKFNGFMFYIANPIFVIAAVYGIKNIVTGKVSRERYVLFVAMLINLIALCCHKTLGGWQFGARYTCDMIPFAFMSLLITTHSKTNSAGKITGLNDALTPVKANKFAITVAIFGLMFNAMGAVEFWLEII